MKVAVIGGGSTYTPELVGGFLDRTATLPITELWLMDVLPERLEVVGGFAQRMVGARGNPFAVHLTTNRREAIQGANYVISQLRVGGMEARRQDEYLGRRHGLVGQETTGVGGMACALRTIPVILEIADDVRELAPQALLLNFANPAGLVTEALCRFAPEVASVGVCNVAITTERRLLELVERHLGFGIEPRRVELDTLGLNHLTWHRGFRLDGQDIWPQVLAFYLEELAQDPDPEWQPATIRSLGMIPNYYLKYYYHTERVLAAQREWPPSRAEEVMGIEGRLLALYAEPDRDEPPGELMQRGGAYYSEVAGQLVQAHFSDLAETHVVNVPHRGAIAGWPEDWVLELPCQVGRTGIEPIRAEPLPRACSDLLVRVKEYELLTAEAAVRGDREVACQALRAHPLGPEAGRVQEVLDDMLETNRPVLPRFWT